MAMFHALPKPKSPLGYHRILSPTAGARVSPLCLGAMNFGDAWKGLLGECSKDTAFEMLDYFYTNGGNFIDTANNYQAEESETWVGEWMAKKGNRDEMLVATKFTTGWPAMCQKGETSVIKSNYQGNHAKSLKLSVDASLRKLQTDYIDLLYIHFWDFTTSIPEVMQALHHLVVAGKVIYLGISDCPAWVVSKANEYARQHGMTQFSVYQGWWSAAKRDFEREILPMCEAEGMAICPWGALGGGNFRPAAEYEQPNQQGRQAGPADERHKKVAGVLENLAKQKGTLITSVALAYVMHKVPYVVPIVGGRKVDHLKGNIEALKLELTDEEMDEIERAAPFEIGFPMDFMYETTGAKYNTGMSAKDCLFVQAAVNLDVVDKKKPIRPHND
ncbi:MAG: hypothetical protein Q9163_000184 [Psora crenata]